MAKGIGEAAGMSDGSAAMLVVVRALVDALVEGGALDRDAFRASLDRARSSFLGESDVLALYDSIVPVLAAKRPGRLDH